MSEHVHQRGFPCPDCDGAREFLASAAAPGLGILGWPEVDVIAVCKFAESYAKWKSQAIVRDNATVTTCNCNFDGGHEPTCAIVAAHERISGDPTKPTE